MHVVICIPDKFRTHKQFYYLGAKCWNLLAQPFRQAKSAKDFSTKIKNTLQTSVSNDTNYRVDNKFDTFYKPKEKYDYIKNC